jgi:ankyrin repeat protein
MATPKSMLWADGSEAEARFSLSSAATFGAVQCSECGSPGSLRCAKCRSPYCSTECQRNAWPKHKKLCRAVAAAAAAEPGDVAPLPIAACAPRLGVTPEELARNRAALVAEASKFKRPSDDALIGNCQLFSAILAKDVQKVKAFLAFGQDVNGRWECTSREHAAESDVGDMPPLTLALARRAPPSIIRVLIDQGADLHHFSRPPGFALGTTPLHAAANAGNVEGMRLLLSRGADPRLTTPLIASSTIGALHCLENPSESDAIAIATLLLDAGADVSAPGGFNETPLFHAILRNKPKLAAFLLSRGAQPDVVNSKGLRAFDVATTRLGREWAVPALLKAGASVEPLQFNAAMTRASEDKGAFAAAERAGKRMIIDGGVEFATSWPFMSATAGLLGAVLPLVIAGVKSEAARAAVLSAVEPGPGKRSLLAFAAAHSDATAVRTILRAGGDPNATDALGHGALWWAAFSGDGDSFEQLLKAGARAISVPPATAQIRELFQRVTWATPDSNSNAECCDETCLVVRHTARVGGHGPAVPALLRALVKAGQARPPCAPCPGCDTLVLQMLGLGLARGQTGIRAFEAALQLGYAAEGASRGGSAPAPLVARYCEGRLTQGELDAYMAAREAALGLGRGALQTLGFLCTPLWLIAVSSAAVKDKAGLESLAFLARTVVSALGSGGKAPGSGSGDDRLMRACAGLLGETSVGAPAASFVRGSTPVQLIMSMHRELLLAGGGSSSGSGRVAEAAAASAQREGLERLMACFMGYGDDPTVRVTLGALPGK